MHREGRETLPEVLAALEIENPVLVGHSDGASIALLHAGAGHPVAGVVVMAPHCFVEDISIRSIAAAKVAFETTDLPAKLGKYHRDVDRTFWGWNDIWLHPDFRAWNIEDCLPQYPLPDPGHPGRGRRIRHHGADRGDRHRVRATRPASNCSSSPIAGIRRTRTRPWR
jgi:pimeloyl-ACP methyl ester carboxylesterase